MKKLIAILAIIILVSISADAQNNGVWWSSFNTGFAESKVSDIVIKSVIGQTFIGTSQNGNVKVISGFLTDTLFGSIISAVSDLDLLPMRYELRQNYPNPFNPNTKFEYYIPQTSRVTLKVYNVLGQLVETLFDGIEEPGFKSMDWNASNLASGVYYYRIDATSVSDPSKAYIQTKTMMLVK